MEKKPTNPKEVLGANKVNLHLIPDTALIEEALALTEGALKYGPFNYRTEGAKASIYLDAAKRHMMLWASGSRTDPLSGISHLAYARACLGILLDSERHGTLIHDLEGTTSSAVVGKAVSVGNMMTKELRDRWGPKTPS